jgi:hypothetical protein
MVYVNRGWGVIALALAVTMVSNCGSGGSSSSPTAPTSSAPSGPLSTAIVLVTNVSVTVEPTATGVIYRSTLTLTEVSHRSGATVASIRVNLTNGARSGSATFDRNDNIVTALAAASSTVYRLSVTSDNRDVFTQVTFTVAYADDAGVGGSFTSPTSTSITPVPAATTPPVLTPGPPAGGGKYDGVYDFFYTFPTSSTTGSSRTIPRFLIIQNSVISSGDGSMAGSVDNFGLITFTGPCVLGNSDLSDFRGSMNASALSGFNFGQGEYTCRIPISGNLTWKATQSR